MADIKDAAAQYITDGWAVVPVKPGLKAANTSWRSKTYGPHHFKADYNIAGKCGEPSGWRVDVDCDSRHAIAAARILLPPTGLRHGRPGKPDSHYWYLCDGAKTKQFTSVDGKMLVELRSTGGYTVLPPSIWTNKDDASHAEPLAWVEHTLPSVQGFDVLLPVVRNLGIAALVAEHWPQSGGRHSTIGHLAGLLCYADLHPREVLKVIEAAVVASGDTDLKDRMNFARATVAKFENGEAVTGAPKLAEELGDKVVGKMQSWLGAGDADAIEDMNRKHFVVRMGKDTVIGREDTANGHVAFQRPRDLRIEYANRTTVVGVNAKNEPIYQNLFEAWLTSPQRRAHREVVFAPPPRQADPNDYNLWKGFAVEALEGDCSLFLDHIKNVICSGNDEHYAYLMNLLAYTVQAPGTQSEVAVVLRGEPGTGKGVFVRALGALFGHHAIHLDKVDHLVGHFNAGLSGKVLVFADEAFWAGDKRSVGALKRLITEPTLLIERKGFDVVQENNCVHLFMATNEEWAIPAMLQERRFFALNVSSSQRQNGLYFAALTAQLEQGGLQAFLHVLKAWPVDVALVRRVPRTAELRAQQSLSLSDELRFWQECLVDGAIGALGWPRTMDNTQFHAVYLDWMRRQSLSRPLDKATLGQRLAGYVSASKSKPVRLNATKVARGWDVRQLADARAQFDRQMGTTTEWL